MNVVILLLSHRPVILENIIMQYTNWDYFHGIHDIRGSTSSILLLTSVNVNNLHRWIP